MKRIETGGLWALVLLVLLLISIGLLSYIDQRFGPEASAFFLGIVLGIPFLLTIVVIVGGIFILIIRGTAHLQERDDQGEIERLRALRELARTERLLSQNEKQAQGKQVKLLGAWQQTQTGQTDWPDEENGDDDAAARGGASYRILD